MYNDKVMEIFQNPKNVGKLSGANAVGKVGNIQCGDIMKIYLKINEEETIEDASFETFGCAAAIVSSSVATELIKGMKVEDALKLKNEDIIREVGELPVHKIHCSVLATEAIEDAVKNYRKKLAKLAKESKKDKTTKSNNTKASLDTKLAKLNSLAIATEKVEVSEEIVQEPKVEEVKKEENIVDAKSENISKLQLLTKKITTTTTTIKK